VRKGLLQGGSFNGSKSPPAKPTKGESRGFEQGGGSNYLGFRRKKGGTTQPKPPKSLHGPLVVGGETWRQTGTGPIQNTYPPDQNYFLAVGRCTNLGSEGGKGEREIAP